MTPMLGVLKANKGIRLDAFRLSTKPSFFKGFVFLYNGLNKIT